MNTHQNYNDLPLLLSVPEEGKVLGISRAGTYELVRADSFPKARIGNQIMVPRDKFIAWIDAQTEADARGNTPHPRSNTSGCTTRCSS